MCKRPSETAFGEKPQGPVTGCHHSEKLLPHFAEDTEGARTRFHLELQRSPHRPAVRGSRGAGAKEPPGNLLGQKDPGGACRVGAAALPTPHPRHVLACVRGALALLIKSYGRQAM